MDYSSPNYQAPLAVLRLPRPADRRATALCRQGIFIVGACLRQARTRWQARNSLPFNVRLRLSPQRAVGLTQQTEALVGVYALVRADEDMGITVSHRGT